MTAKEIIATILQMPDELAAGGAVVTITPGPIKIRVNVNDLEGMKIIQAFPDGWKIADALEVLDAARWWLLYFAAMAE